MDFKKVLVGIFFVMLFFAKNSVARHIFGGDFSMSALGNNRYRLTLNLYFDETQAMLDVYETSIPVRFFGKSDGRLVASYTLPKVSTTNVVYDNAACADLRQLKTSEVRFSSDITLISTTYTDPNGYYVIWERCCRNGNITNIVNSGAVGMVFALEFPPLMRSGVPFRNSSPDFSLPNGDYICVNKPFKFDMSARDPDGDEMRYSLITPLAGFTSQQSPTSAVTVGRWPYPEAPWTAGYNANNAIKGPKPLSIDAKTGMLSVTASQPGLYAFAVLIEEYRGGVRIGAVRREFQLPVVDCSKTTPPVSTIFKDEKLTLPVQNVEFCDGNSVELFVKDSPDWTFQWQRDGDNIPNENRASMRVSQAGNYQVIVSFTRTCANDTISQPIKVTRGQTPTAKITPTDTLKICFGDSATLRATVSPIFQYEWLQNGATISGQNTNTLKVNQAGVYELLVRTSGVSCPARDTVLVQSVVLPKATISAAKNIFCPSDSVSIETNFQMGETAQWYRNNKSLSANTKTLMAKQGGDYKVKIQAGQCAAWSDSVRLQTYTVPKITFDTLLVVCMADTTLPLLASPEGGSFVGKGVLNNQALSVKTMGIGTHQVRYDITTQDKCIPSATRKVVVKPSPVLQLPAAVSLLSGESTPLNLKADSSTYQFDWQPALYLSDATVQRPVVTPPISTAYKATATARNGCTAMARTFVRLYDGLYIPTVFTPNGDGQNDTWEIKNISKYPQTEVTVYNRWGEAVFYQKGYNRAWEGLYNNQPLPAGVYTYHIDTHVGTDFRQIRGTVMIGR